MTKQFDGWNDISNLASYTWQVDKTKRELVLKINDPTFPFRTNYDDKLLYPDGGGANVTLFDRVRYVRMNQYAEGHDRGGDWSVVTDAWVDANDCLGTWIDVFETDPSKWRCCRCPTGGACEQTPKEGIVSRDGYWRISPEYFSKGNTFLSERDLFIKSDNDNRTCTHAPVFVLCPYQERCLGIKDGSRGMVDPSLEQCKVGTEGPMCALCSEGYAREGSSCAPCSVDALGKKAAVFAIGLVLVVIFLLLAKHCFGKMPRR